MLRHEAVEDFAAPRQEQRVDVAMRQLIGPDARRRGNDALGSPNRPARKSRESHGQPQAGSPETEREAGIDGGDQCQPHD